jgi:uncharacterized membrane protein YphA (DoxX/SURF4 family)
MTFSQYAGIAIVPTLARLVLAAVFLFAGYTKLFTRSDFEAKADGAGSADRLHKWDISVMPKNPTPAAPTARRTGDWDIVRVAYRQETPATTDPETPPPTQAPTEPPPATAPLSQAPVGSSATLAPGTYTAPSLYGLAIMLDDKQWPYPVALAWLAALTEFVGGGMMLIGLFSRIWGLALAGVMGVAFYLTSLPALQAAPNILSLSPMESSTLFVQSALFVLALGVALTGAGPLSLDRLLFTRSAPPETEKTTEVRRTVSRLD